MNDLARDGWEYLRADTLPAEEREGLMGRATVYLNMLVFRRPAPAAAPAPRPEPPLLAAPTTPPPAAEPAPSDTDAAPLWTPAPADRSPS